MASPRSTPELVVLVLAGTVAAVVLAATAAVAIIEIRQPSHDTTAILTAIGGVVAIMVGTVSVYVARRSGRNGGG